MLEDGLVKVHLRRWLEDQDAWTLARYLCSPVMQREAGRLYKSLQLDQINSTSLISEPDQALPCSFPFEGPTTVQGIFLRLPGSTPDSPRRWLILRIDDSPIAGTEAAGRAGAACEPGDLCGGYRIVSGAAAVV